MSHASKLSSFWQHIAWPRYALWVINRNDIYFKRNRNNWTRFSCRNLLTASKVFFFVEVIRMKKACQLNSKRRILGSYRVAHNWVWSTVRHLLCECWETKKNWENLGNLTTTGARENVTLVQCRWSLTYHIISTKKNQFYYSNSASIVS